jgi:hypothetical protein
MGLDLILNHSYSEPQSLDGGSPSQLYMDPAANVDLHLCPSVTSNWAAIAQKFGLAPHISNL